MTHLPSISLVICTYRRPDSVGRLLAALQNQSAPPEEVLVVDASQDDATEYAVAAHRLSGLQYFRVSGHDCGLTRQRNYGIARSSMDVVSFLDDDTVPHSDYFRELRGAWARHPEAAGIGSYVDPTAWEEVRGDEGRIGWYRTGRWRRREGERWALRRRLGLVSSLPPGLVPEEGHGRPISFIPPDGRDYEVEFLMGCALSFSHEILRKEVFSPFFEGYGLYEDLEFCIRAGRHGKIVLCTSAWVDHLHDPAARPNLTKYGKMVVRNGWYVWRQRWPRPRPSARFRWWAITFLLALCRAANGWDGVREAAGRMMGCVSVLLDPPHPETPA